MGDIENNACKESDEGQTMICNDGRESGTGACYVSEGKMVLSIIRGWNIKTIRW